MQWKRPKALVWTYAFSHVLWQVGNIEISGLLVTLGLETRVERLLDDISNGKIDGTMDGTHTSEANFVAQLVEATNAKLRVTNAEVLCEAKSRKQSVSVSKCWGRYDKAHTPCKHQWRCQ